MITIPAWIIAIILIAVAGTACTIAGLWLDRRIRAAIHHWLEHRLAQAVDETVARRQARQATQTDEEDHDAD
jgi:hypothetical protein